MELLRTAKRLHDDGFAVIPTGARKEGLTKEWQKQIGDSRVEPNGNFNSDRVHGVGVVTGTEVAMHYLLAIDVDCYDKAISSKMCDYIDRICKTESKLSFRVGEAPKFLVPVLCDQNTRKINSKKFGDSKIEVLGQGQQFVAYGAHPKSKSGSYKWYKREFELDNLPVISMDDIRHIIGYFESLMGGTPAEVTTVEQDDPFAGLTKSEVSLGEAKEILSYIDPDCDYDTWFRVGAALHHEFDGAPEAYDLWDEWSSTGSKYDENKGANDPDTKWASFDTDGDTVSFRTLCQYARKAGADLSAISRKHKVAAEESFDEEIVKAKQKPLESTLFRSLDAQLLKAKNTVYWTIEDTVEHRSLVNFYGESGVGKSYLAISFGLSIATGTEWCGKRTREGRVVYIAGEGHGGVVRRAYAWLDEHGLDEAPNFSMTERSLNITTASDVAKLEQYLESAGDVSMVIVDTWGRAVAGINEDKGVDVQPVIERLADLTRKFNCTVLIVHHTPKHTTESSAGSKNIKASMDVEMALVRETGVDGVVLHSRKVKDVEEFPSMVFKFVPIALPDNFNDEFGKQMRSAVLRLDEDATQEVAKSGPRKKLSAKGEITMAAFDYLDEHQPDKRVKTPAGVSIEHSAFAVADYGFSDQVLKREIERRFDKSYANIRDQLKRHVENAIDAGYLVRYEDENDPESSVFCRLIK